MNKEAFKDEKGTFHYEPVVWGDWEVGDEVVFDGFVDTLHDHWSFSEGENYVVDSYDINLGPRSNKGEIPSCDWGFKFSRKVYDKVDVVEIENKEQKDSIKQEKSLDNLLKELHNLKQEEKELSDKITGIIKDINQILDSCGLVVVYKDDM